MSLENFDRAKALETIKNVNQIIFFCGAALMATAWAGVMVMELFRGGYSASGVHVAAPDKPTEADPPIVVYTKNFQSKLKDTYVFSVTSVTIYPNNSQATRSSLNLRKGREYPYDPTVNFIFLGPDKKSRLLFKKDSMIGNFELARTDNAKGPVLARSVYQVVTEDTNKDGFLTNADNHALYVSGYDGRQVTRVIEKIEGFTVIEDNTLLITKRGKSSNIFYEYKVDTNQLTELDTSVL